jgi:hypothetical protein
MTNLAEEHFHACYEARSRAVEALASVVARLRDESFSELQATKYMAKEMADRGLSSYWYPAGEEAGSRQSGCIIAFDTPDQPSRTAFTNGRLQAASDEIIWAGYGYFYASPQLLTADGIVAWGDIGCTVYFGKDSATRAAVQSAWERNRIVISRLGDISAPTTLDLFTLNADESARRELTNIAWSTSQKGYNIGHCFPTTHADSLNDPQVHRLVSERVYVDGVTNALLSTSPWTYEARDRCDFYPNGSVQFHEVVSVVDGRLVNLPSYEQVFSEAGMKWLTE